MMFHFLITYLVLNSVNLESLTEHEIALHLYPLAKTKVDSTNAFEENLEAANFGHLLFHEKRFSRSESVSCATCHQPKSWFIDNLSVPINGFRNTPTVVDSYSRRWFFWDGRSDSQWGQSLQPLETKFEHNGSRLRVARVVALNIDLRNKYESLFGSLNEFDDFLRLNVSVDATPYRDNSESNMEWEKINNIDQGRINQIFVNIGKSLAAYQKRLKTKLSPVHKWAKAIIEKDLKSKAILEKEVLDGMKIFYGKGRCFNCHTGPNFTDEEFHSVGLISYIKDIEDNGRWSGIDILKEDEFNTNSVYSDDKNSFRSKLISRINKTENDWGLFRTPSLRNVSKTAPYMHDGRFKSLEEVVEHYSTLEGAIFPDHHGETIIKPLNLTKGEKKSLVRFLNELSSDPLEKKWFESP